MTELLLQPRSSIDQIRESTVRQVERSETAMLNVDFLLPKDWLKFEPYSAQPVPSSDLILFGRYGDRGGKALIELYAQPIFRELSSADWFDHFTRRSGYVVEKVERTYTQAGWNVDAIATRRGESGAMFTYRMATFKDAGMVYMVTGFAHPREFEAFQEQFVVAIRSFRLMDAPDKPSAEPLRTVSLSRVLPAQFVIPQTWQRMQDPRTDMDVVRFENKGAEATLGKLTVLVAPLAAFVSHAEVAEALLAGTEARGLEVRLAASNGGKHFVEAREGAGPLDAAKPTSNVRTFVAHGGGAWVGLSRLSLRASVESYPIDAINDRAYEIVLRTLGPAPVAQGT